MCPTRADRDDICDAALEWLAPYGPDLAWGFTSHAPMVVEALCQLGRADAVLPWLEANREGLLPRPAAEAPVSPDHWRDALGKPLRFADWSALFERELRGEGPGDVLRRWLPRLLPGLAAAAAHGVIRTGHAARALARRDTPLRRAELARALGYWAATWQRLPASAKPSRPPSDAQQALLRVPRTMETRAPTGSIVEAFLALEDCPDFAPVIHDFDRSGPLDDAIGELTLAFARVFLADARDRLGAIVFTHGVTGAAALRSLTPHLPEADARDAVAYAWQTGAALIATYGPADAAEPCAGGRDEPVPDRETLVDAAVAGGDDHAIKLTEACLSEYARRPSPVFLAAAARGVRLLAP